MKKENEKVAEEPDKYPRFCPGQKLSMVMIEAILGAIEELRDPTHGGPSA